MSRLQYSHPKPRLLLTSVFQHFPVGFKPYFNPEKLPLPLTRGPTRRTPSGAFPARRTRRTPSLRRRTRRQRSQRHPNSGGLPVHWGGVMLLRGDDPTGSDRIKQSLGELTAVFPWILLSICKQIFKYRWVRLSHKHSVVGF